MREKPKSKGGRPKKQIDYATVDKLAAMMCTQEEISNYLGISVRTLQRDRQFNIVYKKGIDKGKMSLRRMQYQKASDGNSTMLIWLGKQYLGQRDKLDNEISGKDGGAIEIKGSPLDEINSRIAGIVERTGAEKDTE